MHLRSLLHYLFLIGLLYSAGGLHAQPPTYAFLHLNIQQGLAGNHVSSILQDSKGFLWIASTALQRFDGNNFNTIAEFDHLPGSVFYDDICLMEDHHNRIWIGTPQNIRRYDPVTGQVKVVPLHFNPTSSRELQCEQLLCDSKGLIWATSEEGLLRYNAAKDVMEPAPMIPESVRRQMNSAMLEDTAGNLWLSGSHGIYVLDHVRHQLYSAQYNPEHLPVLHLNNSVRKFYIDRHQRLWIASRNNMVYCYDLHRKQLDSVLLHAPEMNGGRGANLRAFDVMEDNAGTVWLATQAGMFGIPAHTLEATLRITGNNESEQGLYYDNEINCFFSTSDGQRWIGTDRGISVLGLQTPGLQAWSERTVFPHTTLRLPQSEVTDMLQTPTGDIYLAYWGQGVRRLDAGMNLLQQMVYGLHPEKDLPNHASKVWSLAAFQGKVLMGQENGELSVYNPLTHSFDAHYHPRVFDDQALLNIYPESDTAVWIGLYKKGLGLWNPQQQQFYNYHQLNDQFKGPLSVLDIVPEGSHYLWLATNDGGLVLWDKARAGRVRSVLFKGADSNVVNNVLCLYRTSDSSLLAGTDHGLFMYNTRRDVWQQVKTGGHVFEEWVLHMQRHGNGVWLTTPYGFYTYRWAENQLEMYQQNDDIIDNNRRTRRRILPLQDGHLLVGASNFVVSLLPAMLQPAPPPPDVTITGLRALDSTILFEADLLEDKPVPLTARQNSINISFRSIHYNRARLRYAYKLEGLDENWSENNQVPTARYTNLSPGMYTFKVKASNTAGTYSDHVTMLKIYIHPAFWQTWWFRALCGMAVVGVIFSFMRYRIHRVQKQAKRRAEFQQQISQSEMKALRAQMNPHFIFNALNSIQLFMMKNQMEQALAYLGRFARLIRDVLDHSQLNTLPLSKELKMLENYMELEKLRFADQFQYSISISPALDPDFIEIPSMILQPFVENAIWHGLLHKKEMGILRINFEKKDKHLLCIIQDNGIGRERSAAIKQQGGETHHSRGLQITRDRLSLYNSRFNVEASFEILDLKSPTGDNLGTQVNIWIPMEE
ncbi:Two component regulator propeller [Chitinophaga costaii]|uniref:Two component regulator propeller n=1 Tax=Chitinophaga costaii TaxID=1335309 RepID=A0A1C4F1W1_9BACT|nr:sensor histidine kinase [Chitinophaga costaii]PUZ22154.1 hypothetical protein DCM91_15670 [Chitinophaga costaii]SCC49683.1 Two component regulator propeller [Chitinophaga costaii]